MLRSLDTLSTVAVDTVDRSKDDMVADLQALAPTLRALADSGKDLPDSLQVMLTYPFTDEVLNGVKGDYLNVYLDLTAAPGTSLTSILTHDENQYPEPTPTVGPLGKGTAKKGTAKKGTAKKGAADRAAGLPLPLPPVTATTTGAR
jgi:phospholipid/cholesterol/gamma-HCH transport system substrate-binding protein